MDLQSIELSAIKPAELDSFLELGWFRIQQTIFTTDILYFNGIAYDAVWLRIRLEDFHPDKRFKELSRKNSRFKIEIKKAIITPKLETLYASYKESISFECASSLQWLLYGNSTQNVYDTWMISMYDSSKLAGVGFFDVGHTSAAGISSVYDPAYKKCSLGKYLIYEKIHYCKQKNYKYFYPGYFAPGYAMFDYKLEIGKAAIEYFNPHTREWLPFYQGVV